MYTLQGQTCKTTGQRHKTVRCGRERELSHLPVMSYSCGVFCQRTNSDPQRSQVIKHPFKKSTQFSVARNLRRFRGYLYRGGVLYSVMDDIYIHHVQVHME